MPPKEDLAEGGKDELVGSVTVSNTWLISSATGWGKSIILTNHKGTPVALEIAWITASRVCFVIDDTAAPRIILITLTGGATSRSGGLDRSWRSHTLFTIGCPKELDPTGVPCCKKPRIWCSRSSSQYILYGGTPSVSPPATNAWGTPHSLAFSVMLQPGTIRNRQAEDETLALPVILRLLRSNACNTCQAREFLWLPSLSTPTNCVLIGCFRLSTFDSAYWPCECTASRL
mmetsp:Transcript_4853/g.9373  ORF Transcript_4853/g.9373 Transcript_4853/m.9373 type:complete len:231 (-) Transcript_4853:1022-1714(-)